MPAKDIYHDVVKQALIKDGWTITDDLLRLRWAKRKPRHLARHVVRREVAVDLRHLEAGVTQDPLQRQRVASAHHEVTGEGVA